MMRRVIVSGCLSVKSVYVGLAYRWYGYIGKMPKCQWKTVASPGFDERGRTNRGVNHWVKNGE